MLDYFKTYIYKPAKKLELAQSLPARESIMLLDDSEEPRSSDYTEEQLNKQVVLECKYCYGTGKCMYEEDTWDICDVCEGHGKYLISNL